MLNKTLYGVAIKWLLAALVVIYLIAAYSFHLFPFHGQQQEVDQAKATANQATAIAKTATDAVKTVVKNDQGQVTFKEAVAEGQQAVDKAPIDAPPEVTRQAVVNAVCKLPEYKKLSQCQARSK